MQTKTTLFRKSVELGIGLFTITSLLLAGCGGGSGSAPSTGTPPVSTNTTPFPINATYATFNSVSQSITLLGLAYGIMDTVTNVQTLTPQVFLGQVAYASSSSSVLSGPVNSTITATNYYSVNPYKNLGAVSTGIYTVYANQVALPATALIGATGNFDTGKDFSDSTQTTTLDTFVETWSLSPSSTTNTANFCIKTVYKAIARTATSGTSTSCLNIDANGNILTVQLIQSQGGQTVTLDSSSIVPILTVPEMPTISSVTAGAGLATIYIAPPLNNGGSAITSYTVTAIPSSPTLLGNITATSSAMPITISNLTGGIAYRFTVTATNSSGISPTATTTNTVTPAIGPAFYISSSLAGYTPVAFPGLGGIATDSSGNIYVSDLINYAIRKITPAGVASTLAGSGSPGSLDGTGTAASFFYPNGVAVDSAGNVYVADTFNSKIRKITPLGVVTTLAGSGAQGNLNGTGVTATFNRPFGIAVDNTGNVYVADSYSYQIRKIDTLGVVTTLAGSGISGNINGTGTGASFGFPNGIAVDGSGNVYVADRGSNEIRVVTPAGVVTTMAGSGSIGSANGTGTTATLAPDAVAVDSSGNVYVAEGFNHDLRKITPAGVVTTFVLTGNTVITNSTGAAIQLSGPSGVSVDGSGNIYVSDSASSSILKLTLVP